MLADYKFWLASIAVVLSLYAYVPYVIGLLRGRTKPHLYTWIVWVLVSTIAVVIQHLEGAGMGAWPSTASATLGFFVLGWAVVNGNKKYGQTDLVFLGLSLAVIPFWLLTNNPSLSAILVTLIQVIAGWPTLRKCWYYPEQEPTITYGLNTLRHTLAALALSTISIATVFYPLGMILMNGSIWIVLMIRPRQQMLNEVCET